jgi:[protein-PII] uridylyltransferase
MIMTSPHRKKTPGKSDETPSLSVRAAKNNRDRIYRQLVEELDRQLSSEELDIHFTHMPIRYWSRVHADDVRRHLLMIHDFFASLQDGASDGTAPIIRWRQVPERHITEVEICTWDRIGLMSKVAGAMAAVGLNIIRADIFTRADNVALDLLQLDAVTDELSLAHMAKLLTNALVATEEAEKNTARYVPGALPPSTNPPVVTFDADGHPVHTVLNLEADDRVGLLYDVFTALAECNVNVAHAIITTENSRAGDVFFLTDSEGRKLADAVVLGHIRRLLLMRLESNPALPPVD